MKRCAIDYKIIDNHIKSEFDKGLSKKQIVTGLHGTIHAFDSDYTIIEATRRVEEVLLDYANERSGVSETR